MNAGQVNNIRDELSKAIADVLNKHGMSGDFVSGNYSEAGFQLTLKAQLKDVGNGKSGAQLEYEIHARKFGIDPKSFGKTFTSQGKTFRIVGINPRARTMPILAIEIATGVEYKFTAFGKEYNFMVNAPIIEHNFGKGE